MVDLTSTGLTLNFRPGFALAHIRTAAKLSKLCRNVEIENEGEKFGPFFDDLTDYSTACVMSCVASLEAYINEIFIDRNKHFESHDINLMHDLWDVLEKKSVLDKFQFALLLKNKKKLDSALKAVDHIKILIKLRNSLVHFKPEWVHLQKEHDKIGKALNGKFEMSPFLRTSEPIFPLRCMSYSMTNWAIRSSYDFIEEFSKASKIENRIHKFKHYFYL
tara:strand:- start:2705 stop:3361 length:657 start_codon:yes stop_codon:yes gene_type:complete